MVTMLPISPLPVIVGVLVLVLLPSGIG